MAATYMHAKLESPPATALHCQQSFWWHMQSRQMIHPRCRELRRPGPIPATHRFQNQTGCKVPIVHTCDNNVKKMTTTSLLTIVNDEDELASVFFFLRPVAFFPEAQLVILSASLLCRRRGRVRKRGRGRKRRRGERGERGEGEEPG